MSDKRYLKPVMNKPLQRHIQRYLTRTGQRQYELAETLGVIPLSVSGWIRQGRIPRTDVRRRLCELLDADECVLFPVVAAETNGDEANGDEQPKPQPSERARMSKSAATDKRHTARRVAAAQ